MLPPFCFLATSITYEDIFLTNLNQCNTTLLSTTTWLNIHKTPETLHLHTTESTYITNTITRRHRGRQRPNTMEYWSEKQIQSIYVSCQLSSVQSGRRIHQYPPKGQIVMQYYHKITTTYHNNWFRANLGKRHLMQ